MTGREWRRRTRGVRGTEGGEREREREGEREGWQRVSERDRDKVKEC